MSTRKRSLEIGPVHARTAKSYYGDLPGADAWANGEEDVNAFLDPRESQRTRGCRAHLPRRGKSHSFDFESSPGTSHRAQLLVATTRPVRKHS